MVAVHDENRAPIHLTVHRGDQKRFGSGAIPIPIRIQFGQRGKAAVIAHHRDAFAASLPVFRKRPIRKIRKRQAIRCCRLGRDGRRHHKRKKRNYGRRNGHRSGSFQVAILRYPCFRLSCRIASSIPPSVSGYMRSFSNWRIMRFDWL